MNDDDLVVLGLGIAFTFSTIGLILSLATIWIMVMT